MFDSLPRLVLLVSLAGCRTTIQPNEIASYDFATQRLPWCEEARFQERDLAEHEHVWLALNARQRGNSRHVSRKNLLTSDPFVRCFERMLLENERFWSRVVVVVDFETNAAGMVDSLCVAYGPPSMPETTDCVGDVVRSATFVPSSSSQYNFHRATMIFVVED